MSAPLQAEAGRDAALAHVAVWIFDLDNTLYPASCNLFDQIDRRMMAFVQELLGLGPEEARALQKRYFREHGTTLRGLMDNHGLDPAAFLDYVHAIDHSPVPSSPRLARALARLAGRKIVFTNGSAAHAGKVMARLGVGEHIEAVFDIAAAGYVPKPERATYERLLERLEIDPGAAAIVDDIPKNLEPAAALGMTTVWLRSDTAYARHGEIGAHVHHIIDDLADWLDSVLAAREAATAAASPAKR